MDFLTEVSKIFADGSWGDPDQLGLDVVELQRRDVAVAKHTYARLKASGADQAVLDFQQVAVAGAESYYRIMGGDPDLVAADWVSALVVDPSAAAESSVFYGYNRVPLEHARWTVDHYEADIADVKEFLL